MSPQGEGWTLFNIGMLNRSWGNYDLALACFLYAKDIFNTINDLDNTEIQSDYSTNY
ncbi:hypothetical protein KSF_007570 [Reticulibacter mediterranei]|uniref:Tetratricopeptide repeat protein n=1 Tax=Reticulibacter mediterranei TaxID=2778369 RepID=A0A8J3IGC4_9CHLR|nr:hypothetical protein KSF_007570 [Reticulibacter mediterranei]